jgi:hypothetical protein
MTTCDMLYRFAGAYSFVWLPPALGGAPRGVRKFDPKHEIAQFAAGNRVLTPLWGA